MTTPGSQDRGGQVRGAVELSRRAFGALSRRDAVKTVTATSEDVHVEVRSSVAGGSFAHEDLWRDVTVDGREQLHDYLLQLFRVLPSLTMVTIVRDGAGLRAAEFTVELAGVTTEGKPFEAVGSVAVTARDNRIRRLHVDIAHMAVGPELLRRAEHDPRKYFEYFLEESGGMASPGLLDRAEDAA